MGKKNGTSGKFCNLAGDRYSRISMAWKTAVEKNRFDVVLSNVGGRGEVQPIFFLPDREKKIHIKSNLAPCGIRYHAESYAYLFFFYEKRCGSIAIAIVRAIARSFYVLKPRSIEY